MDNSPTKQTGSGGVPMDVLEAELARRMRATLGVVVASPKDVEQIKKNHGEEGLAEIMEQIVERLKSNVRRVDLVTMLDKTSVAVISVDRNPGGPRVLADKVYRILNEDQYVRMGMPVTIEVAVGGISGRPSDNGALKGFIDQAKDALGKAITGNDSFIFDAA